MNSNLIAVGVILALPLTLALLAGVIFLLTRHWQSESALAAQEAGRVLNEARRKISGLRRVHAVYAEVHRQPYTQLASDLKAQVEAVERDAGELELAWQDLEARRQAKITNRLRAYLQAAPAAFRQRGIAQELSQRRADIQRLLAGGQELARRLEQVPAEVAERAGAAGEGIETIAGVLSGLEQVGLRGAKLEEAQDALLQLQQAHARIPTRFGGPEGPAVEVEENANWVPLAEGTLPAPENPPSQRAVLQRMAGETHDLLSAIEPVLAEWLPRVQGWEQQERRLAEAGQRLQKTLVNFRLALSEAPAQLILNSYQAAQLKVGTAAEELAKRRAGAQIPELRTLERQTALLERTLEETALHFDQTVREVGELDRLLLQLEANFKILAGRMAQAEIHEIYPLAWDVSRAAQIEMQEHIAGLGRRDTQRTPEQVAQALNDGKELSGRLSTLLERVGEQSERYQELVQLLETPELAEGGPWSKKTLQMAREAAVFDPANWARQEDVGTLERDAAALEELQRRLAPLERPAVIKETGLARRLEDTRRLLETHHKLRPRAERVRTRLVELRGQEQDAHAELERLKATLEQLAALLNNNTYLQEVAGAELARLRSEGGRVAEELGRPAAGALEKKALRLRTLEEALTKAASGWLDRLSTNIQTHTRSIVDDLAALDQIAALDDREVTDARELLRRLSAAPTYGRPANYMEAAVGLKRCAGDWQNAAACAAALDACGQPVLEGARDAEAARKAARAVFQSAPRLAGGRREWPPARQKLEAEYGEFCKLEARLDGLHGQRTSAGRLVRELGLLFHELDKIDDRAAEALRQAESERTAATEVENEIIDLQRGWQNTALRFSDVPEVNGGARELAARSDQRLRTLQKQFKNGSLDYDQTLSGLQDTAASLRGARFTTRDGRSIGIDS